MVVYVTFFTVISMVLPLAAHLVTGALLLVFSRRLVHTQVVESIPVAAIHIIVLPIEICGVWVALILYKPRGGSLVVYAVPHSGYELYFVVVQPG